jgi:hypothetical protein
MNMVLALALSVGVLAGGKFNGVKKAAVAGLGGMFWVAVAEMTSLMSGQMQMEWIFLAIGAFFIVLQSRLSWFSFVPAGLAGAAVIAAGGPIGIFDAVTNMRLAVVFVLGTVVGLIAEMAAGMMAKKA